MELEVHTPIRAPPMMKQTMAAMKKLMGHHLVTREGWPGDDMIKDMMFLVGAVFVFFSAEGRKGKGKEGLGYGLWG